MAAVYQEYLESRRQREADGELGEYQSITAATPIAATNIGHQMLLKMGWKQGTGLGRAEQGRLDPVGVSEKREMAGLGRMAFELQMAQDTTEHRRLLESEMVVTYAPEKVEELKQKWKGEAERAEAIKANLKEVRKVFLCELCNKQYTKVSEYDNHLSSYDHHHTKRLKELREREKAQKRGGKKKRAKKEQEREMARITALAAKAQQAKAPTASVAAPVTKGWQQVKRGGDSSNATSSGVGGWGAAGSSGGGAAPVTKGWQPVKLGAGSPATGGTGWAAVGTAGSTGGGAAPATKGWQPAKLGGGSAATTGGTGWAAVSTAGSTGGAAPRAKSSGGWSAVNASVSLSGAPDATTPRWAPAEKVSRGAAPHSRL